MSTYYRALVKVSFTDGGGYLGFAGVGQTQEEAQSMGATEAAKVSQSLTKSGIGVSGTAIQVEAFEPRTFNKES